MVRLGWTEQALNDLHIIGEFIAKDSIRFAKLTVRNLREFPKILKKQPYSGRIVPEINDPDIRELIMGNYRIIYTIIDKNQIDILVIHHSARKLE